MKIERAITNVKTLGPGNRLCIWTIGCKRKCLGCVSKRLQDDRFAKDYVIEEYLKGFNLNKVDGVTISGGEPFEQIDELNHLIDYIIGNGVEDILVYTGFTIKELKSMNNIVVNDILTKIAVLIDGPYVQSLNNQTNNLKGSENQVIHFLKPIYKDRYDLYLSEKRSISKINTGDILIGVGIPTDEIIKEFNK